MIGATGTGKSSLCQSLCLDGERIFKTSSKKDSCTSETNFVQAQWRFSCARFMLIDTPGFSDTKKSDDEVANLMVVRLA